jgi:hypothetical protein
LRAAGSVFQDGDTPELFMSNFQKFLFRFLFSKKEADTLLSLSRFIMNNDTFRAEKWIEEVDTKACDFVEDVVNLRFDLVLERSATETEHVLNKFRNMSFSGPSSSSGSSISVCRQDENSVVFNKLPMTVPKKMLDRK